MHRVSSDQEATTYNKRGNWGDMQYLPILNLVGRILWGSISWNHPKYFARRKALCWVSNHATYQPEALLVWYMHYEVAIACKPHYNNDACKCNEFRE